MLTWQRMPGIIGPNWRITTPETSTSSAKGHNTESGDCARKVDPRVLSPITRCVISAAALYRQERCALSTAQRFAGAVLLAMSLPSRWQTQTGAPTSNLHPSVCQVIEQQHRERPRAARAALLLLLDAHLLPVCEGRHAVVMPA